MSDPFPIIPVGKSWADLVEEDDSNDEQDLTELQATHTTIHSKETEPTLVKELDSEKQEAVDNSIQTNTIIEDLPAEKEKHTIDDEIVNEKSEEKTDIVEEDNIVEESVAKDDPAAEKKPINEDHIEEKPVAKQDPVAKEELAISKDNVAKEEESTEISEEQLSKDEPVKEEAPKEEPVKEESVKEEPVKEESVKEESVKDDAFKKEEYIEEAKKKETIEEEAKKEEEPAKPVVLGAKASRWASAPSDPTDPPKVPRWERSTPSDTNSGASASKWASSSTSSFGNRSRYDDSRGRYNDRYNNYDAPTGGRLNKSTFEQDSGRLNRSTFENSGRLNRSTFEDDSGRLNRSSFENSGRLNRSNFESSSRNHYDIDFDRQDRNGGFDNRNNFKSGIRKEPEDEESAQAIKNWNAYKPPADENKPLPRLKHPEEEKVKEVSREDKPLPPIEDEPTAAENKSLPPVVEDKSLPPVEKKKEKLPLEDIANFKPAFSWADDMDDSSDEEEEEEEEFIEESNEDQNDKPEPVKQRPTFAWGSLEKTLPKQTRPIEESTPVVDEVKEVPVSEPVLEVEEKPTFTWGSLEEVKPEVKAPMEKPAVVIDVESSVQAWNSLVSPTEEKPLPQTPPTEVQLIVPESTTSDWNTNVTWNTETTQAQPKQDESWNTNASWNNNQQETPAPVSEAPAWGTLDDATPVVTSDKPVIKDSWKNKIPIVEEDRAYVWKSFAENIAVPPPAPVVVEEKKREVESVTKDWNSVQENTSWNAVKEEPKVEQPTPSWGSLEEQPKAEQPTPSWNSVQEQPKPEQPISKWGSLEEPPKPVQATKPREVTFKLTDFTSNKEASKAPATASFKLSDFGNSTNASKPPTNASFKISDFASNKAPFTASFKLSDFASKEAPKSPGTASLKLSNFTSSSPKLTSRSSTDSYTLKLSDYVNTSPKIANIKLDNSPRSGNAVVSPEMSLRLGDSTRRPSHNVSLKLSDFTSPTQPKVNEPSTSWNTHNTNEDFALAERNPESWGQTMDTVTRTDNRIVENSEHPKRKIQMAGAQWNALQENLMGGK